MLASHLPAPEGDWMERCEQRRPQLARQHKETETTCTYSWSVCSFGKWGVCYTCSFVVMTFITRERMMMMTRVEMIVVMVIIRATVIVILLMFKKYLTSVFSFVAVVPRVYLFVYFLFLLVRLKMSSRPLHLTAIFMAFPADKEARIAAVLLHARTSEVLKFYYNAGRGGCHFAVQRRLPRPVCRG